MHWLPLLDEKSTVRTKWPRWLLTIEENNMPTGNEYSRVIFGSPQGDNQGENSGDFGQINGQTLPWPGDAMVPEPVPSKQFSSDVTGNPEELCRQTLPNIEAHADLNYTYGLCQPVSTLGSHAWLRDELSNTTEYEPGNAVVKDSIKTPE